MSLPAIVAYVGRALVFPPGLGLATKGFRKRRKQNEEKKATLNERMGGSTMNKHKAVLGSAVVIYFLIAFEILIMISPFAGFFYAAFSPVLLTIARHRATHWMSSFFFTHMLVPPDDFLKFIRIMGSVLFVLGLAAFLICAIQVYASKLLKKGPVIRGIYSYVRHPQYLSLGITGIGLAILWPRFLVLVLWIAMVLVYFFLAKDEEGRMERQHPEPYKAYMNRTGMFLPRRIEKSVGFSTVAGKLVLLFLVSAFVIGGAFLLRDYTVKHLPLWTRQNVVAIAVLPEDQQMMEESMDSVIELTAVKSRLNANTHYLVYFLPVNYVMQGLIADTGGNWRLYEQHHTIARFVDWVFHPFTHMGGASPSAFGSASHAMHGMAMGSARRLIFLEVSNVSIRKPSDVFAINAIRTPDFMIDLDVHDLNVLNLKSLPEETAWGRVPTPAF